MKAAILWKQHRHPTGSHFDITDRKISRPVLLIKEWFDSVTSPMFSNNESNTLVKWNNTSICCMIPSKWESTGTAAFPYESNFDWVETKSQNNIYLLFFWKYALDWYIFTSISMVWHICLMTCITGFQVIRWFEAHRFHLWCILFTNIRMRTTVIVQVFRWICRNESKY